MIKIITEEREWNAAIQQANHSDFYHTYHYHDLSKKDNENPVLIKYEDDKSAILLPLLIRDIENTEYKDATSVYGYSGVLSLTDNSDFDHVNFKHELDNCFKKNKIVSVFSRLHPYLKHQENILSNVGRIVNPGNVIYIDLTESLEVQRSYYSRRLKTYVNKAQSLCSVIKGHTKEHIEIFKELYYDNMRRVNANESYFFEERYFYELMDSSDFETDLLLCVYNETQEVIAGGLFIKTGEIVQYHLSGLGGDKYNLSPVKYLIDNMRVRAKEEGYKVFNLGGGRSNKQDSLYAFKASFSKNFRPFLLWKYIADEEVYADLVKKLDEMHMEDEDYNKDFFPSYRRLLTK
ncbi:GNAT family N-acetyltransferase [Winogradskyella ursingii]|uniref:GNAT family N-acetyltransferase n=1 Tax=Winogradskyella ursingii TaxID=2686079 RepID=UPI0015CDE45A|nr:GNAT family N-acetyltransferase [Winogradskyella ursingii]